MKYFIIILALVFTSCASTKKPEKVIEKIKLITVHDTIHTWDTLISIKLDSTCYNALIKCDSLSYLKTKEIEHLKTKHKFKYHKSIVKTDTFYIEGDVQIFVKTIKTRIIKHSYKAFWWVNPLIIWSILTTLLAFGAYIYIPKNKTSKI